MALPTPNLDDRTFQDIVREARGKIPLYCPDWTDYNLSDPGITLIEMFAWMVEMILYRLNQVPEKNYVKFMELIGIQLDPPKPAVAPVTFLLSAPQPDIVVIPRGTEVATTQTEFQDAIIFTTDTDLPILVPSLNYALTTPDDKTYEDIMPELSDPDVRTAVFQDVPQEGNAVYFGFEENLHSLRLVFNIRCVTEGTGIIPQDPPRIWEYWDGALLEWSSVRLISDTTGGLNTNGSIVMDVPVTGEMSEVDRKYACWIRCRATKPRPNQSKYNNSPMIQSIDTESIGGTVSASQALRIVSEELGKSNGSPGQKFQLLNSPVLPRESDEFMEVETENDDVFEPWEEVGTFSNSTPDDPHFTCDSTSGEIQLGPSVRYPSGEEIQYGKLVPEGRKIRFSAYRCGGGTVGNVGERKITVLKSSIPYVDSVVNLTPATGGLDAETMENAKTRVPRILKTNTRAVTAEDYEYLALEGSTGLARAKCIPAGDTFNSDVPPGTVRLYLVPALSGYARQIPLDKLEVSASVHERTQQYLDERRLLATRLEIHSPEYVPVAVSVRIKTKKESIDSQVLNNVENRLYQYLNPLIGGMEGIGWSFGRSLSVSEIFAVLQDVSGVDYIEDVILYPVDRNTGERQDGTTRIDIPSYGLICSEKHEVIVSE